MNRFAKQAGTRVADRLPSWRVAMLALMLAAGPTSCMAQIQSAKIQAEKPESSDEKIRAAQQTLEQVLHAYVTGDSISSQPFFDPAMLDLQGLIDNIRDSQNQQKQLHISISDMQAVAGRDSVQIQLNWEKRYLTVAALTPKLVSGHSSFQMKYSSQAWRIAGFGGDNLFAATAK